MRILASILSLLGCGYGNKRATQSESMERMLEGIGKLVKESKPHLNGEKFLSNQEASKYLKVSIRTLQEWRDTGVIPYIQIKGKIIYRESDIERLLQTYYNKERQE